jgi:hypothetical protein
MDPQKLAALASGPSGQSQPKPQPKGKPQKNGGGGKPNPHQGAHPDMDEKDESEQDESSEMEPGMEQYAELMQKLEASAEDVEEQAEGLDQDMLDDPGQAMDDDGKMEVEECLEGLPDDLVSAMHEHLKGISHDDAMKLADHLESEGMIDDADMVGGFLFRVGQLDGMGGEDDEHDGDDMDEDLDDEMDY